MARGRDRGTSGSECNGGGRGQTEGLGTRCYGAGQTDGHGAMGEGQRDTTARGRDRQTDTGAALGSDAPPARGGHRELKERSAGKEIVN